MDRKFLEGLSLEKETIDTIMGEYGKSINEYKKQVEDSKALADQLDQLKKDKTALSDELNSFKTQASESQSTIDSLNKQLSTAKMANLKTKVALDQGLPYSFADRLHGDDEEALTKDAQQLAGVISKQQTIDPLHTTEPKESETNPYRQMLDNLHLGKED